MATIYRLSKITEKWDRPRGRCQEEKKEEKNKSKTKPVSNWRLSGSRGCNEGTPRSSLELDLPWVRGALGEGGGAGESGAAKDDRVRPSSNSPSRLSMEEDASLMDLRREKG